MKDNGRMDQMGWLKSRVLRHLRPVLRQVHPGYQAAGRADRLRVGAERAELLPGRQPDRDELPRHELELLRPGRVHQEPPLPGAAGPPA